LRVAAHDPRLWLGGSFYVVSFLMWVAMLSMYDVARIYPLALGLGYAATVLLAVLVLREHVSGVQLAGIVLIGTGLVALVVR
jgi:multidrug transporter EmrE-like cation transporter